MKRLWIIGAGGFGREIAGWARASRAYGREWRIEGFLDDNPRALDGFDLGLPIAGGIWDFEPGPQDCFVCAIGQPALRAQVWDHFRKHDAVFSRVIHEESTLGRGVELGEGVILCPRVVLTCDLELGDNTALNIAVAAGHDVRVGRHCQLSSFCDLTGFVQLGDQVFMGSRASIIPGRKVGDRAVVGAGSVVIRDVPPDCTVFGNPARIIFQEHAKREL